MVRLWSDLPAHTVLYCGQESKQTRDKKVTGGDRQMKLDCGHEPSEHSQHTTGYGTDSTGKTFCYECAAKMEREYMIKHGETTLYLTEDGRITDWPGHLVFKCGNIRKGHHNIAGVRYDTWFVGPDKHIWHGVQYGDNTQLCHCKRTKELAA